MNLLKTLLVLVLSAGILSCNNNASTDARDSDTAGTTDPGTAALVREEAVSITADTATLNSYVAYNANDTARKPIVLIVPEWWGLNDYVRSRARQLAQLGY